jgi:hypothetical protein
MDLSNIVSSSLRGCVECFCRPESLECSLDS